METNENIEYKNNEEKATDGQEIQLNGENYKITIYDKDSLLRLVKVNDNNSKYEDVISVINDEEGNRVMMYHSSNKDSIEGEFSNVAIKRPKENKNDFKFRYANENEVYDWKDKDSLYEVHDFIQEDVKSLLQAEKLFDEMNRNKKFEEIKEEKYEVTKDDLKEVAKEQRLENMNEVSRKIKEDIKTEEKNNEKQGENEK